MVTYRAGESTLPQNIDAEQAVLGSLLIDARAIERVSSFLRADDFYLPVNTEIFRGMLDLYERDMPTDIVTLADYFQARQRLDDIGGPGYLASLASIVPTSINVEYYARIVERLGVLRRLVEAGARISSIGFDERLEADMALEQAEKVLFDISRLRVTRDFQPLSKILGEVYEKIDHIHSHESEVTGVTTGFIDLDRLTSGLQRSDLVILAARPSMGKTSLALNIAHAVASRSHLPVGIFSIEMSAEQLAQRLISLEAQVDSQRLRSGRMSDSDWDRLVNAIGALADTPIFIDDTPALSTVEMRSKARRLHAEQGLGLLVVDYLQLMHGASNDGRVQEISAISRSLKAIARELDVPVLALSQLSRAPEQRPNHEPMLSDLRESGCLSADSMIYLPDLRVYRRIDSLVGVSGFRVLAVNTDTQKLEPRWVTNAFCTGRRRTRWLQTRLGRSIRATGNHKFLIECGWRRLDELHCGDLLAVPHSLNGSYQGSTSRPTHVPVHTRGSRGCSVMGSKGTEITSTVGAVMSRDLKDAPSGDIYWDQVESIEPGEEEEVFDLTVEGLHNFVANDIVVHNSIEQDADVVMFIYRDVVYNAETERPHVADILVGKHRNGPTGKVHLFFQESLMKFIDLSVRDD